MKRCVIIAAAKIQNYERIKKYLRSDDFYIFCDAGLQHQEKLNIPSDLIIGDFDSYTEEIKKEGKLSEIITLPCEKDDTDLFYAAKEGVKRGFSDFLILGAIGERLDHSLCNISALLYLYKNKKNALLLDDFSEMQILGKESIKSPAKVSPSFSYFSLICLSGIAKGVTIKNAKYPLKNAIIKNDYQYAVSNEVSGQKEAEISVKKGQLLLIKDF